MVAELNTVSGCDSWSSANWGISGYTVATYKDIIDARLAASDIEQDYVLINLGTNDVQAMPTEATWKSNYQYIVDAMHTKWPSALIYITKPWRSGYITEPVTMAGWIDDLIAANTGLCFEGINENVWFQNGVATYSDDGIHYNTAGSTEAINQWVTVFGY